MYVVILAAGYGTRLYPLTLKTPKALLPVCGRPVIEHILEKLKRFNFKKVIIVTNEKHYDKFLRWLSEYIPYQPLVLLSDGTKSEKEKLGAIGDLKFVLEREKFHQDLLLLTSDMIFSFSLNKFLRTIENKRDQNWILLYKLRRRKEASKYGVVSIDEFGKVIRFEEKPSEPFSNLVSFGIYYLPRNKLNLIDRFYRDENITDALGKYFQWLVERDLLYGYVQNSGVWIDVGDKEQYQKAEEIIAGSRRLK